jgi:hemoglobin
MRHAEFSIGEAEREAWFRHMAISVGVAFEAGELSEEDEARMLSYFAMAAAHMINVPETD